MKHTQKMYKEETKKNGYTKKKKRMGLGKKGRRSNHIIGSRTNGFHPTEKGRIYYKNKKEKKKFLVLTPSTRVELV
jgi:hypothetical protein